MRLFGAFFIFSALTASSATAFAADHVSAKRRSETRGLCGLPFARHRRHGPRGLPVLGGVHRHREDQGRVEAPGQPRDPLPRGSRRRDPTGYKFFGTCIQTDGDGDKLFMTYEGPESGPVEWIGGTGKYKDVVGSGTWSRRGRAGQQLEPFRVHAHLRHDVDAKGEVSRGGPQRVTADAGAQQVPLPLRVLCEQGIGHADELEAQRAQPLAGGRVVGLGVGARFAHAAEIEPALASQRARSTSSIIARRPPPPCSSAARRSSAPWSYPCRSPDAAR